MTEGVRKKWEEGEAEEEGGRRWVLGPRPVSPADRARKREREREREREKEEEAARRHSPHSPRTLFGGRLGS